jgi:hypothetical protein
VSSTATATFTATAVLPSLLLTWRCGGCRRIVARLQYDGRTVIEVKHPCNRMNRLPDDAHNLRAEGVR